MIKAFLKQYAMPYISTIVLIWESTFCETFVAQKDIILEYSNVTVAIFFN